MSSSEMELDQCPSCGSEAIDSDSGIAGAICESCGLVHDGEEWASGVADNIVGESQDGQSNTDSNWREEVTITDASDKQLVTILSKVDDVSYFF